MVVPCLPLLPHTQLSQLEPYPFPPIPIVTVCFYEYIQLLPDRCVLLTPILYLLGVLTGRDNGPYILATLVIGGIGFLLAAWIYYTC